MLYTLHMLHMLHMLHVLYLLHLLYMLHVMYMLHVPHMLHMRCDVYAALATSVVYAVWAVDVVCALRAAYDAHVVCAVVEAVMALTTTMNTAIARIAWQWSRTMLTIA